MTTTHNPVVFRNSAGEEISNDPIWLAKQTLRNSGVDVDETRPQGAPDDEDFDSSDYAGMTAQQLKDIAKEKGVSIKGLKKVGEVRAALEAFDEEQEALAAAGDDDEDDDTSSTQE